MRIAYKLYQQMSLSVMQHYSRKYGHYDHNPFLMLPTIEGHHGSTIGFMIPLLATNHNI